MKNTRYILIDTGSESNRVMMSDVGRMENGVQLTQTYRTGSRLLDLLIRAHFSYAVTRRIDLPGKAIWNRYCVLNDLTRDGDAEYYIVVVNNAIHRLSVKYLNEMARRENVHLYSLLLDAFDRLPANVGRMIRAVRWEGIYSFQRSDCEKYGFAFTNRIYSRADLSGYMDGAPKSDVFFVGLAKDRIDAIDRIRQRLSEAGLVCDFTVIVDRARLKDCRKRYPGLRLLTTRVGYGEVLRGIAGTRAILELCQQGQDGLTMRFYEAIFYNKRLITNNPTALESPYYDPRYMAVIRSAEDLDPRWLSEGGEPDYHYNDEYTPARFVRSLSEGRGDGGREADAT